ncbi:MAG: zf-TFIIB domain-containing protein [Nanobdellota archaeon]
MKSNKHTALDNGVSRFTRFFTWLFTGKKLYLSDTIKLKCPRCCTKMDKIHKGGVTIDVCPHCKGIFLDDGEIDKLSLMAKKEFSTTNRASHSKKKTSKKVKS